MSHGNDATPSQWDRHVRQWSLLKAPLAPCAEDIRLIEDALAWRFADRDSLDALMLGVTPAVASHDWRPTLNMLAVDITMVMIQRVWPGNDARRRVICGDWLRLPLRDGCFDLALIDGGLPALTFPDAHQELATELYRVLRPGGEFIARIFARPDTSESVDDVLAALNDGKIGNFHVFKWRLAMALQGDNVSKGIRVEEVWQTYEKRCGPHARMQRFTGWPIEEISTIDAYRGSQAIYHFPTVSEMVGVLGDGLTCIGRVQPRYELGERCPTLVFDARRHERCWWP